MNTAISSTTLSGYVDTSAWWWFGVTQTTDSYSIIQPPPLLFPGDGPIVPNQPQTTGVIDTTLPPVPPPAPVNDAFAWPFPVTIGANAIPEGAIYSTLEAGEPRQETQTGSIWFKWVIPASGGAHVSTSPTTPYPEPQAFSTRPALSDESIFYPWGGISYGGGDATGVIMTMLPPLQPVFPRMNFGYLAAFRGSSLETLTQIKFGPDLEFDVTAGETIWIALEVFNFGGSNPLPTSFSLSLTPPPANDSFASALAVHDTSAGRFTGYLAGATREAGEPELRGPFAGGSVWFKYTAATFGNVGISGNAPGPAMAVFEGNDLASLRLVASTELNVLNFFGREGVDYYIALYRTESSGTTYDLNFTGPQFRLYETTLDELMPNGLVPHFYGVRGSTMMLYAKSVEGWKAVEVEPIFGQAVDLLARPASLEGKLRVITIDAEMPAPRIEISQARGNTVANLVGTPGQTCAVSFSTDLVSWSAPQVYTLNQARRAVHAVNQNNPGVFYRITQSLPTSDAPKKNFAPAP